MTAPAMPADAPAEMRELAQSIEATFGTQSYPERTAMIEKALLRAWNAGAAANAEALALAKVALEALGRACIHGPQDHKNGAWRDEVMKARKMEYAALAAIAAATGARGEEG